MTFVFLLQAGVKIEWGFVVPVNDCSHEQAAHKRSKLGLEICCEPLLMKIVKYGQSFYYIRETKLTKIKRHQNRMTVFGRNICRRCWRLGIRWVQYLQILLFSLHHNYSFALDWAGPCWNYWLPGISVHWSKLLGPERIIASSPWSRSFILHGPINREGQKNGCKKQGISTSQKQGILPSFSLHFCVLATISTSFSLLVLVFVTVSIIPDTGDG